MPAASPIPTLTTPRLRLRPMELGDLDALAAILGDPETMRHYEHPFTRDEVLGWIVRTRERYERHGLGLFGLELRETGEFVGDCGPAVQTVEGVDEVELGWHIRRDLWRGGLATEAAIACRDRCFEEVRCERLISLIDADNVASSRVAEKIGMRLERLVDWRAHRGIRLYAMSAADRTGIRAAPVA